MKHETDNLALKGLLDICEELFGAAAALAEAPSRGTRRKLQVRRRELIANLTAQLEAGSGPSFLTDMGKRSGLSVREQLLFLILLERRLASPEGTLEGRELLQVVADGSFDLLEMAVLLQEEAPLVQSGLVQAQLSHPEGTLEGKFQIAERIYRQVYRRFHHREGKDRRCGHVRPYPSSVDHYLDLRNLVSHHQKRAAVLFPQSYWVDVHGELDARAEDLDLAIDRSREFVARREKVTGEKIHLPLRSLREEFGLDGDEEMIILALLFQELFASSPLLEAAELLRLVAASEEEVFRKRHLIAARGRLVENGLIALDMELDDKRLMAGTYLPEWVVDRLLHRADSTPGIRHDERLRFHDFLDRMDGSEDFYRNL
jgi:hypothetical protein